MKTTIDLPDDLFQEAKRTALDRRTTLRALMMNGLRREIRLGHEEDVHGLSAIFSVGKGDWSEGNADQYVTQEREGWA